MEINEIEKEINNIKERNKRVETDKAWEVSLTRRLSIAILTYIVVVIFFITVNLPRPFLNPLVPTLGFLLSTLSLDLIKRGWVRRGDRN